MYRTPIREVLAIIVDHFRVIKLVTNTFYMQSGRYLGKSVETVEQAKQIMRGNENIPSIAPPIPVGKILITKK